MDHANSLRHPRGGHDWDGHGTGRTSSRPEPSRSPSRINNYRPVGSSVDGSVLSSDRDLLQEMAGPKTGTNEKLENTDIVLTTP